MRATTAQLAPLSVARLIPTVWRVRNALQDQVRRLLAIPANISLISSKPIASSALLVIIANLAQLWAKIAVRNARKVTTVRRVLKVPPGNRSVRLELTTR
jgi:hypothetical protein